jgi:Trypsin-co-occurring domain 2
MGALTQCAAGVVLVACAAAAQTPTMATLPVSQVIEAIKSEIAIARLASDAQHARFKISSVEINLTAVAKAEAGGGIRVEIPVLDSIGGGEARADLKLTNTQRIRLTLIPEGTPEEISGGRTLGLAPAILSVKSALQEAGRPPYKFALDRFVFEAEFAIARSAEGGVRFLFLDAGGDQSSVATQHLAVHMTLAD